MYNQLTYFGIKNKQENLRLSRVTVLTGPNESGKSAAIEAAMLAATGRSKELGSQPSSQVKLTSGNASSLIYGNQLESQWELKNGKKLVNGGNHQGGLPVTTDEFWSLSGAERTKLLVPESDSRRINDIDAQLEQQENELKRLKALVDQPSPRAPDPYTGEPLEKLKADIATIDLRLAKHSQSRDESKLQQLRLELTEVTKLVDERKAQLTEAQERHAPLEAQLALYGKTVDSQPRIISHAREKNLDVHAAFEQTLSLVKEAARWWEEHSGFHSKLLDLDLNDLPKEMVPEIEHEFINGEHINVAAATSRQEVNHANMMLSQASFAPEKIRKEIEAEESRQAGERLSDDEFAAAVIEKQRLESEISRSQAWKVFEDSTAKINEERMEAKSKLDEVDSKIKSLRVDRDEAIRSLKARVEEKANQMLKAAGLPPLMVTVKSSGRKVAMDITTGSIAIEALAKSRRILYGLCILSAIHELSDAECPLLTAECAEMDENTFDKAIAAMALREKGNVILEHCWASPRDDSVPDGVTVIDLACGVEV